MENTRKSIIGELTFSHKIPDGLKWEHYDIFLLKTTDFVIFE
jgi:hypothetical protein